jgi:hypothetical protein
VNHVPILFGINPGTFVAGTVPTGGLAALAIKVSRKKNNAVPNPDERSNKNPATHSR